MYIQNNKLMYSPNNHTKAISARLAAGLTERIDFERQQSTPAHPEWGGTRWNRNYFLNCAAELLLMLRHSIRCGNLARNPAEWPPALRPYAWMLTD